VAAEIVRAASEAGARLIILCKHNATGASGGLSSTVISVLHEAPCPVVLVSPAGGPASWRLQHILVPHDGAPRTSTALRPAADLAKHAGADLLVAHVAGVGGAATEPGSLPSSFYVDQPQHDWPAWTGEFAKRLGSLCPLSHLHVRIVLAQGSPAEEVPRLAREQSADLVVLAWRGLWEAPRSPILKGIVGGAQCPVMIVRA
jgi:nucleotide-binding universal stress UspA family protein